MKNLLVFLLIPLTIITVGCTTPGPRDLAQADFGFTPSDYQEQIKEYMSKSLFDPYSAKYQFGHPHEAAVYRGILRGGGYRFGHAVDVLINAKNRFGGYVGAQEHIFFFTNTGALYPITNRAALHRVNSQYSHSRY